MSFTPSGEIVVTDKVGDVYLYPFEPRKAPEEDRPNATTLASDPSKTVEADLLLGHVSLITTHLLIPDGRHIITADRDEHIRISRFPQSYVIERFLFGSEAFVSALHIPPSRPDLLICGGGEGVLRIWDWQKGEQVGVVDIREAILPHRRVRSSFRKVKHPRKRARIATEIEDPFYTAPEGFLLPEGEGICIKKIISVRVGGVDVVVFFSEG